MPGIRETDLPGIGRKFQVETRGGDKLVIVIHDDGRRELYHFCEDNPEESISMVSLDDDEARQVAGIIGGLSYTPKALESMEVALDDLVIEWIKVGSKSPYRGRTIGELQVRQRTGATIIGIVGKDNQTKVNPGPDQTIWSEAILVVAGERKQVKALKKLVEQQDG